MQRKIIIFIEVRYPAFMVKYTLETVEFLYENSFYRCYLPHVKICKDPFATPCIHINTKFRKNVQSKKFKNVYRQEKKRCLSHKRTLSLSFYERFSTIQHIDSIAEMKQHGRGRCRSFQTLQINTRSDHFRPFIILLAGRPRI